MPQDPFGKVSVGDPVSFSAQAWNGMMAAAKAFQQRGSFSAKSLLQTRSSTIIRVRNDTSTDLVRSSVVGLSDPLFTPDDSTVDAFMQEMTFKGVTPNSFAHKRKYAIMLDPVLNGRIGRAYLSGLCQVLVDQQDESHEYANIIHAVTNRLKSSVHGHARILWREGLQGSGYGYYDTGIQWAIVMLGVTGSSGAIGKANGVITAHTGGIYSGGGGVFGTGNVDIYVNNGGTEEGPVETITVLNTGTVISSGKQVAVEWDSLDDAYVAPLECE